jgi:hypothetical protein
MEKKESLIDSFLFLKIVMRKLINVTFTGIDQYTNPQDLWEIQEKWPKTEFGILFSQDWSENGIRYPDPKDLQKFKGLNLSAHLCGQIAREAARGQWDPALEVLGDSLNLFKRIQVNVPTATFVGIGPGQREQEIIQQRQWPEDVDFSPVFEGFSVLLDASGGRGIPALPVATGYRGKIGYAGGIGPDNVVEVIKAAEAIDESGEYWIDMETKIRDSQDHFSPDLIKEVLTQIWPS